MSSSVLFIFFSNLSFKSLISSAFFSICCSHSSGVGALPFPHPVSQMATEAPVWSGLKMSFDGVTPLPTRYNCFYFQLLRQFSCLYRLLFLFPYDRCFFCNDKEGSLNL